MAEDGELSKASIVGTDVKEIGRSIGSPGLAAIVRDSEKRDLPLPQNQQRSSAATPESLMASSDRKVDLIPGERILRATIFPREMNALTRRIDALKVEHLLNEEPTRDVLRLWVNGPAYQNRKDAFDNYGSYYPILCFLSVDGSDDIWAAFQTQPRNNGPLHSVEMSRIDRKNRMFDPTTQRRYIPGSNN